MTFVERFRKFKSFGQKEKSALDDNNNQISILSVENDAFDEIPSSACPSHSGDEGNAETEQTPSEPKAKASPIPEEILEVAGKIEALSVDSKVLNATVTTGRTKSRV